MRGTSRGPRRDSRPGLRGAGYLYAAYPLHALAACCPPAVVGWPIMRFARPGDLVLDPMVGSDTTPVSS
jgi:hypothetical protein